MEKWRKRIPAARWRKIHFCIWVAVVCLLLLFYGLVGWALAWLPILMALFLIGLDIVGTLLFFRCPKCGERLPLYYKDGYCLYCGTFFSFLDDNDMW